MLPIPPQRLLLYAAAAAAVLLIGLRMQGGGSTPSYSSPGRSIAAPAATGPAVVVVDVVGAVRRPGVYRLPEGARVQDAVQRAHATRRAQLQGLNLAERLADGEQVVVPGRGGAGSTVAPAAPGSEQAPVHLNSASLEQLETLDGVGPSLAQRIVDYRTQHGGFRSLDELDQVSGFGPARLAALRGHVAL